MAQSVHLIQQGKGSGVDATKFLKSDGADKWVTSDPSAFVVNPTVNVLPKRAVTPNFVDSRIFDDGSNFINIAGDGGDVRIGDILAANNRTTIILSDFSRIIYLHATTQILLGDTLGFGFSTTIQVNDAIQEIRFNTANLYFNAGTLATVNPTNTYLPKRDSAYSFVNSRIRDDGTDINIDSQSGAINLGDLALVGNGTVININDPSAEISLTAGNNILLNSNNVSVSSGLTVTGTTIFSGLVILSSQLRLAAGTAASDTAPIRFTTGTLQTTQQSGILEYASDKLYFTINTGTIRYAIPMGPTHISGGGILFTGPTATRTVTFPNSNFSAARIDTSQSFAGTQTFTGQISSTSSSSPQVLIAPSTAVPAVFIGRVTNTGQYAQFGFQNSGSTQRTFIGYVGSTFGTASRQDHYELGTGNGTNGNGGTNSIYFRPGDTQNTFEFSTTGQMITVAGGGVNLVAITQPATAATLTIANNKTFTASNSITIAGTDGKTLTISNNLTLAGTDGTVMTFPATSASIARIDAVQTFTGNQTFTNVIISSDRIRLGIFTVGTLPAGAVGDTAYVSDATVATFGIAPTGGGGVGVPVYWDGAWKIG